MNSWLINSCSLWAHFKYHKINQDVMTKEPKTETFEAMVQSRGQGGRKVIELPKNVRKSFNVGKHVKVIIKELI